MVQEFGHSNSLHYFCFLTLHSNCVKISCISGSLCSHPGVYQGTLYNKCHRNLEQPSVSSYLHLVHCLEPDTPLLAKLPSILAKLSSSEMSPWQCWLGDIRKCVRYQERALPFTTAIKVGILVVIKRLKTSRII